MKLLHKNKRINRNNDSMVKMLMTSLIGTGICVICFLGTTFAWFTDTASTTITIQAASYDMNISIRDKQSSAMMRTLSGHNMNYTLQPNTEYEITLTAEGTATTGFCKIRVGKEEYYYTKQILTKDGQNKLTFSIISTDGGEITFIPNWGTYSGDNLIIDNMEIEIGNFSESLENIEKPTQNTEDTVTKEQQEQSGNSGEVEDSKADSLTPEVNENQGSIIEKEETSKDPELDEDNKETESKEDSKESDDNEVLEEDYATSENDNSIEKEETSIGVPNKDTEINVGNDETSRDEE